MYSGLDVTPYLEFIEYQLAWFDKYYRKEANKRSPWQLDGYYGNGTLILYPASAAETYKEAYNPSSTTSGLRKLITDLLAVDQYRVENRAHYLRYLSTIPQTPLRQQQGHTCIAPALAYTRIQNSETPQLYPVFPWGEYGLGRPNLTHAIDTYLYDTETQSGHGNKGWNQDVIWLARMGLTQNATEMTEDRFRDSDVCKFPAFKGPHFDWTPDLNHYGAAALGLHEQLVQTGRDPAPGGVAGYLGGAVQGLGAAEYDGGGRGWEGEGDGFVDGAAGESGEGCGLRTGIGRI
ncbi:hypothetical protein PG996_013207 [Apiospora saccharicola]|uniref:Uncharacterized protein n=1 Tax=Apiospora saccharicola TaxID=335842 RepID=A0ABR1U4S8_9PEZI